MKKVLAWSTLVFTGLLIIGIFSALLYEAGGSTAVLLFLGLVSGLIAIGFALAWAMETLFDA